MKILIGVPSTGVLKAKTAFSLVQLAIHAPCEVDISMELGCNLVANRVRIANYAVKNVFTHLLFVDSDMFFAPDTLERLLAHDKDIVGVAYHKRSLPLETTVKMHNPSGDDLDLPDGLFIARALGTGLLLINTSVFMDIKRPWFTIEYTEDGQAKTSEDVWFCKQAQKAGYEVWCDPTIPVGHIGDYLY